MRAVGLGTVDDAARNRFTKGVVGGKLAGQCLLRRGGGFGDGIKHIWLNDFNHAPKAVVTGDGECGLLAGFIVVAGGDGLPLFGDVPKCIIRSKAGGPFGVHGLQGVAASVVQSAGSAIIRMVGHWGVALGGETAGTQRMVNAQ